MRSKLENKKVGRRPALFSKPQTVQIRILVWPKVVCSMLYVNTSKICSIAEHFQILIWRKFPSCIRPVHLVHWFLQCSVMQRNNQNPTMHLLLQFNEKNKQTNKQKESCYCCQFVKNAFWVTGLCTAVWMDGIVIIHLLFCMWYLVCSMQYVAASSENSLGRGKIFTLKMCALINYENAGLAPQCLICNYGSLYQKSSNMMKRIRVLYHR